MLLWTRTNRQPHPPDLAVRASLLLKDVWINRKPPAKLLHLLQRERECEVGEANSLDCDSFVHGVYCIVPLNLDGLNQRYEMILSAIKYFEGATVQSICLLDQPFHSVE